MQTSSQALYRTGRAFSGDLFLCWGHYQDYPHSDVPQLHGERRTAIRQVAAAIDYSYGIRLRTHADFPMEIDLCSGDSALVHHANDSNISCAGVPTCQLLGQLTVT
jgi:hypothetical protein